VRTRRQRNADVKLMLAATAAVLIAGFVIAAGILVATNTGDRVSCGRLPIGDADSIREDLEQGGPFFQTGGADCSFWLALDEGDIVAYRTEQAGGCTLNISRESFVCGSEPVDVATLARFPVAIETRDEVDTVIVDLTDRPTPSSSSPSSSSPSSSSPSSTSTSSTPSTTQG
jgi:hypothetical protein